MAKLYFYYGAMNSSKTANALMTHFNYEEVGQKALLCKTDTDTSAVNKPVSALHQQHKTYYKQNKLQNNIHIRYHSLSQSSAYSLGPNIPNL